MEISIDLYITVKISFLVTRIKGSHTENVFMRALEIVVDDIQEGSLIWLNILMMLIALTYLMYIKNF